MTLQNVISQGFNLVRKNLKLLVLLWCTNAAMSIILSIPIYSMLFDNLNHSLLSDELSQGVNYLWFAQFMNIYKGTIAQMPLITYGVVGLYAVIQTFYFGGLIAVFNNPGKNHISDFFYGGVRLWYRFMKILLISLFFFTAAFKINDLLGNILTWLFSDYGYYLTDFILRSMRYILLIILIGLVTLISDYTKVGMGVEDKNDIFKSIVKTLLFVKQNYRIVFVVFLLVASFGAIGAIIYNLIDTLVPRSPFYFLLLTFILQQMLIIFRLTIRMLFCSTEVLIYSDSIAEYVKSEVKESTVGVK
ncbi:MAG: hypothetical protein KKB34_02880 [Bacteroidetes bacterium]|nr:hypothetical protein [Bacteroidota bacterium]